MGWEQYPSPSYWDWLLASAAVTLADGSPLVIGGMFMNSTWGGHIPVCGCDLVCGGGGGCVCVWRDVCLWMWFFRGWQRWDLFDVGGCIFLFLSLDVCVCVDVSGCDDV